MLTKALPADYKTVANQEDVRPWWEKYESNAEKTKRELSLLVTNDDLRFLKQFGTINVSIAGIWAVTKMLKK